MINFGPIPDALNTFPQISPTGLAKIVESPAHYWYYKNKKTKPTQAMIEGTIIHMACLEPEKFYETYTCALRIEDYPDALFTIDDLRQRLDELGVVYKKSLNKPQLIELVTLHDQSCLIFDTLLSKAYAQKKPISKDLWDACTNLTAKIRNRPFESKIWDVGIKEQWMWWIHPKGVIIKMRPDLYAMDVGPNKLNIVLDIKKVTSVSDKKLKYEMIESQNPMKAALYADGLSSIYKVKFNQFCFLYVTADEPYSIRNLALNEAHLEAGRMIYESAIDLFLACHNANKWPDAYTNVTDFVEPFSYLEYEVTAICDRLKTQTGVLG